MRKAAEWGSETVVVVSVVSSQRVLTDIRNFSIIFDERRMLRCKFTSRIRVHRPSFFSLLCGGSVNGE